MNLRTSSILLHWRLIFLILCLGGGVFGEMKAQADASKLDFSKARWVSTQLSEENLFQTQTTVFVFMSQTCPICRTETLELRKLREKFEQEELRIILVFQAGQRPKIIRSWMREYQMSGMEVVIDKGKNLTQVLGATVTPEVMVYAGPDSLIYRGLIDDQYAEVGKKRPRPTINYVETAILATLKGQSPEITQTNPVGCFIER